MEEVDTITATLEHLEQEPDQVTPPPYSKTLLFGGTVGRIWLWFVVGCLAVTLIPMLFGWRPYVIQSGSMEPRIKVGDIVLASPNHNLNQLLGHVTVFQDPDFPNTDRMKTHRVVSIAKDGRLVTKGDANQSADSVPVSLDKVAGIGRLMVRWAGLPLVWAHTGKWLYLLLFCLSLYLSALFVAKDREPYEDDEPAKDNADDDPAKDNADDEPEEDNSDDDPADDDADDAPDAAEAAGTDDSVRVVLGMDRRRLKRAGKRLLWRSTALLGLALMLALPMAHAAFAAISKNTADSWSVSNWDYTTEVLARTPYLYWKLDDATTTAADTSGNNRRGTYNGTFTQGVAGALTDLPNKAVTVTSAASCINSHATVAAITGQTPVTVIAWVKGVAGTNGKVVGFEKPQTGVAVPSTGTYDRMLYVDGNGKAWFGVYNGAYFAISSPATVMNNSWHMLAATLGPGGMRLYLDGVLVANNANNAGEATSGWWRVGCGNLAGWGGSWTGPNSPGIDSTVTANRTFNNGNIDEVSIHASQLTAAEISFLYAAR
jgi:signal peptidase I